MNDPKEEAIFKSVKGSKARRKEREQLGKKYNVPGLRRIGSFALDEPNHRLFDPNKKE